MEDTFSVESTTTEIATFSYKAPCQKPMMRQTEWRV